MIVPSWQEFRGRIWRVLAVSLVGAAIALPLVLFLAGCSQATTAPVTQPIQQPQDINQRQAAQGSNSDVKVYVFNSADPRDLPAAGLPLGMQLDGASVGEGGTEPNKSAVKDTRAGYVQNVHFTIQTGGSSTGEQATGPVAGAQAQPGATITQSPEQKPEGSVQVPIAVAGPGGAAFPNAAGATGQGTVTLTPQQQAELRTLYQKALSGDDQAAKDLIAKFGDPLGLFSSTQPAGGSK